MAPSQIIVENLLMLRFGGIDEGLSWVIKRLLQLPPQESSRLVLQSSRDFLHHNDNESSFVSFYHFDYIDLEPCRNGLNIIIILQINLDYLSIINFSFKCF